MELAVPEPPQAVDRRGRPRRSGFVVGLVLASDDPARLAQGDDGLDVPILARQVDRFGVVTLVEHGVRRRPAPLAERVEQGSARRVSRCPEPSPPGCVTRCPTWEPPSPSTAATFRHTPTASGSCPRVARSGSGTATPTLHGVTALPSPLARVAGTTVTRSTPPWTPPPGSRWHGGVDPQLRHGQRSHPRASGAAGDNDPQARHQLPPRCGSPSDRLASGR